MAQGVGDNDLTLLAGRQRIPVAWAQAGSAEMSGDGRILQKEMMAQNGRDAKA
jgi:hypothetical protein